MNEEKDLLDNINDYLKQAKKARGESANVAFTLYFKALAILTDLFILKKEGFIPSNHSEKFRLLENKYPFLYQIMDKNFPVYQRSYSTKLSKEHINLIEDDIEKSIKFTGIKIN